MDPFLTHQKETNRFGYMPTLLRVFGISLGEAHWVLVCLLPQAIKRNESPFYFCYFRTANSLSICINKVEDLV